MSNELNKIYSQEDMDNIVAKVKSKAKADFDNSIANDFIAKKDFQKLQQENNTLRRQVIQPKIEAELRNCGIKKECMNDFLSLNKGLFDCKEEDIKYNVVKCAKERPYMFNTQYNAETGNNTSRGMEGDSNNMIDTALGTIIARNK